MTRSAIVPSALEPGTEDGERLARHRTIVELVRMYEAAVADVRAGFALLRSAEERMDAAFNLDDWRGSVHVRDRHGRRVEVSGRDEEDAIAQLRLTVWGHLVDRLEVRRFLSVKRAAELKRQGAAAVPPAR